jgi:UDP-glucose 6-dehydrogenase
MANKQTIELNKRVSVVSGVFDTKDDKDIIIVNETEYDFEEIKKYFYGGVIKLELVEIEE